MINYKKFYQHYQLDADSVDAMAEYKNYLQQRDIFEGLLSKAPPDEPLPHEVSAICPVCSSLIGRCFLSKNYSKTFLNYLLFAGR